MNDFQQHLSKTAEIGFVKEVVGSIAIVSGLPTVRPDEFVVFESGDMGQVFTLSPDVIEVLTFSREPVKVGTRVARTDNLLEIPVGEEFFSKVIDPFGQPFEAHNAFKIPSDKRSLNTAPPGIVSRKSINRYFETGVPIVDLMVPLGKGQRQLVIGDRKTGKSNFLLKTIVYAAKNGDLCIYAAIGKNKMDIKKAEEYFDKHKVKQNIIIVATSAEDPAGLIYLTPYSAMSIAEYFRDKARDVLIVLDDLSTHAKFYREISLIGKRFPGRDSYPGDMFHVHARLLERAGNFAITNGQRPDGTGTTAGEVSITCLPVTETLGGDLSGYIQTNIMSMTDGHIYFDSNLFTQGRRPSVNPFLSVTRVGRQTQSDSKRSISRELLSFLTLFDKMQNVVHFGSELTENVKIVLETGNKILQLFDQEPEVVVPSNVQCVALSLLWGDDFKSLEIAKLIYYKDRIYDMYQKDAEYKQMVDEIVLKSNSFNEILLQVRQNADRLKIDLPKPLMPNVPTPTTQTTAAATQVPAATETVSPEEKKN